MSEEGDLPVPAATAAVTPSPTTGYDPMITAKDYPPAVKARAYELFLSTALTAIDIGMELGIHPNIVGDWARDGRWAVRKKEIENDLMAAEERKYRSWVAVNRLDTAKRHLGVAAQIEEVIGKAVKRMAEDVERTGHVSDMVLKRLAESLASAASVSARAVGLTDNPVTQEDEGKGGKAQKQPLIFIGVNAQAPEVTIKEVEDEP